MNYARVMVNSQAPKFDFPPHSMGGVSYVRIATLHLEIHFTSHQNPPNPLSDFWEGDLSKYYDMLRYVTIEILQQNIMTYHDIS